MLLLLTANCHAVCNRTLFACICHMEMCSNHGTWTLDNTIPCFLLAQHCVPLGPAGRLLWSVCGGLFHPLSLQIRSGESGSRTHRTARPPEQAAPSSSADLARQSHSNPLCCTWAPPGGQGDKFLNGNEWGWAAGDSEMACGRTGEGAPLQPALIGSRRKYVP